MVKGCVHLALNCIHDAARLRGQLNNPFHNQRWHCRCPRHVCWPKTRARGPKLAYPEVPRPVERLCSLSKDQKRRPCGLPLAVGTFICPKQCLRGPVMTNTTASWTVAWPLQRPKMVSAWPHPFCRHILLSRRVFARPYHGSRCVCVA